MRRLLLGLSIAGAALALAGCKNSADPNRIAEEYNYIIGTQTIGPKYKFTDEHVLIETARRIKGMGSNFIKFSLNLVDEDKETAEKFKGATPFTIASQEETTKSLLDMDFARIMMWVTTPGVEWNDGMSSDELEAEYNSMYELTAYLLEHFNGTGKEFYLGHWEGDWLLLGSYTYDQQQIDPVRIKGMTDWYNIRQQAVENARDAISSDVKVYHYAELNRVIPSLEKGQDRIVNRVLPLIDVDYVSYSSYESISEDIPSHGADLDEVREALFRSLDYIESNMKPRPEISGKRVFIGEYGYQLAITGTPEEQARRTFHTIRAGIEWGCPFILYWEMYDNEGTGFWMIDDKNIEQPVYKEHQLYYDAMKRYVCDYADEHGEAPPFDTFRQASLDYLESRGM